MADGTLVDISMPDGSAAYCTEAKTTEADGTVVQVSVDTDALGNVTGLCYSCQGSKLREHHEVND